jgi:all-trans-retinol 13,14-reductase
VSELVFQRGRVVGVRVDGEEILAYSVISGIGARETFRRFVPETIQPRHASRIQALPPSCSILTLYLALRPEALMKYGLHGVNYWVEGEPGSMRTWWQDLNVLPSWFVLSLAARFQHEEPTRGQTLAEIFVGIPGKHFSRWHQTRVMKRGQEYADFKEDLVQKTLNRVERTWPGFGRYIDFIEAATPATIRSYTGHSSGAAYGIAPVPGRYSERGLRAATGVPGLFLCGQDVAAPGVIGAFYGGLTAASALLKCKVATRLLKSSTIR